MTVEILPADATTNAFAIRNGEATTIPIRQSDLPAAVFVDMTGRRRRRTRLAFYAIGGISAAYAGLVGVSLAGGPIAPEKLIPFSVINVPGPDIPAVGAPADPVRQNPVSATQQPRPQTATGAGAAQPRLGGVGAAAAPAIGVTGPAVVGPTTVVPSGTPGPTVQSTATPTGAPSSAPPSLEATSVPPVTPTPTAPTPVASNAGNGINSVPTAAPTASPTPAGNPAPAGSPAPAGAASPASAAGAAAAGPTA